MVANMYSQYIKIQISSLLFLIPANTSNRKALRNELLGVELQGYKMVC